MEQDYVKADNINLPRVDSIMVASYFATNPDFCSAEYRNVKTATSSRESYGDDAIGYVQLFRSSGICIVKARVCPEHKVRSKPYSVTLQVNENEGRVDSVQCHDCAASQGGCKHSVALLMWVHRRSEEPSSTSRECYWKKPKLAQVGSTLKFIKAKQLLSRKREIVENVNNRAVLDEFLSESNKRNIDNCQLIKHQPGYEPSGLIALSMHYLFHKYAQQDNCEIFLQAIKITEDQIKNIEQVTKDQSKCMLWYELRYGRITASIAYEVSRCNTSDGTLIAKIMGARTPDMPAMKRGRALEDKVRDEVAKKLGKHIVKCGLCLSQEHPILAVSPDGICDDESLVEIKCPSSEKSSTYYVNNDRIAEKFYCQMQMQMYVTGKKKCYFCVADCKFEINKSVNITEVQYSEQYSQNIMLAISSFWKNNVFPLLYESTRTSSDLQ